ncbi:hypothetical protein HMSSN036_88550 [Paenibacillus macerans]|nr:hypothetical protein HMSSN036_88550 [Paenibacillus macerans]
MFGIEGKGWITSPDTALSTLVLLTVWQFGSSMVIFLAGLKQIPNDLYEASAVDGAAGSASSSTSRCRCCRRFSIST